MFRLLCLTVLFGLACCGKIVIPKNNPQDDELVAQFNEISTLAVKNIQCLENCGPPSANSTTQMAYALRYFSVVYSTVPELTKIQRNILNYIRDEMCGFISKGAKANKNNPSSIAWVSQYKNVDGERFSSELTNDGPRNDQTYLEVLEEAFNVMPRYLECLGELYTQNVRSDGPQTCQLACEPEIFNPSNGFSCSQKAFYCRAVQQLNCTNMQASRDKEHCSCVLRDVETMLLYKNEEVFNSQRNFFNIRVTSCAGISFEEFLSDNIIEAVVEGIDDNGCVGANLGIETMQVLTTQTLSILGMKLRHILEKIYVC